MKAFTIYYDNVRGVKSKLNSIQDYAKELEPTIICLVETHLATKEKIEIEGYTITLRYRTKILKYTIDEYDHFLCFFGR